MPKGWLDGADETKGLPLGCELGAPVLVGAAKVGGLLESGRAGCGEGL